MREKDSGSPEKHGPHSVGGRIEVGDDGSASGCAPGGSGRFRPTGYSAVTPVDGNRITVRGRLVTPTGVVHGDLVLQGGEIVELGNGFIDRTGEVVDAGDGFVLPGFVDLHVHGGAGATFDEGGRAFAAGLRPHRQHGTTRSLLSLVTAPATAMLRAIAAAAEYARDDATVLGLHVEGPFLSEKRRGVHDPAALLDPDPALLKRMLEAGSGHVRVVTLAPELPGGQRMVRQLVDAGVHPAVGHSDAEYDAAIAAFRAGADLVTHAFNGMRPLHHREPAILGAAMDAGVVLEVINDGVHVHESAVRLLHRIAPNRVALVTDAMAATCAGDGLYRLGAFDVRVAGGVARLVDGDSIAGSTLTMDVAVQRAVQVLGMGVVESVAAAATVPATLLGVGDRFGSLAIGRVADLVFTDAALKVRAVMISGKWLDDRRP